MVIKNSKKEKELEKQRYILSLILTGIIYIFIVVLLILFINFKTDDKKEVVMTVRLRDKLDEELGNLSSKEREKIKKEQSKAAESFKKKLEKSKKKIEEKIGKQKKTVTDETETVKRLESENVEKKDIFEEYLKAQKEEKNQARKEFFEENKNSNDGQDDLNKLKNELSMIDRVLGDIDNQGQDNGALDGGGDKSSGSEGINWEGGKHRDLIYKTVLNIPDKFKKMGLKTSLKLKFTVFENGFIIKTEILESTGYPELDQDIISQFKNWKFKESIGNDDVIGVIEIVINY